MVDSWAIRAKDFDKDNAQWYQELKTNNTIFVIYFIITSMYDNCLYLYYIFVSVGRLCLVIKVITLNYPAFEQLRTDTHNTNKFSCRKTYWLE